MPKIATNKWERAPLASKMTERIKNGMMI